MKAWRLLASAGLIAVVTAAEDTKEPPTGFGGYRPIEFRQSSLQSVSRRGAAVLKLESVQWVHGESDHFVYHFEKGFLCPQFATAAELFYRRIKENLSITQDSYERKAHIFVFLGTNSWHEFSGKNKLEKWTGSLHAGGELYIQSRPNQRLDRSPNLPHEITHLIVHRFVGDVPLWLNEGLAEFEGRRQRYVYMRTHSSGKTVVLLPNTVPRAKLLPLAELAASVDYPDGEDKTETFYAEAELLVHHLIVNCGGTEPFLKFVKLQSEGLSLASTVSRIYGERFRDMESFEDAFAKYAASDNKLN